MLQAVIEDRAPWPGIAMPASVHEACAAGVLEDPESICAAVLIAAPSGPVWEAIWSPETGRAVDPENVWAWSGHVPDVGGTRLELTIPWPATAPNADQPSVRSRMAEQAQRAAHGYKTMIEKSAGLP